MSSSARRDREGADDERASVWELCAAPAGLRAEICTPDRVGRSESHHPTKEQETADPCRVIPFSFRERQALTLLSLF